MAAVPVEGHIRCRSGSIRMDAVGAEENFTHHVGAGGGGRMNLGRRASLGGALIFLIAGIAMSVAQTPAENGSKPRADIIFIHGNVYTGVPAEGAFSSIVRAEAIAVRGDRIQAVGKLADLQKFKGDETQLVDLQGHFVDAWLQRCAPASRGCRSDEAQRRSRPE